MKNSAFVVNRSIVGDEFRWQGERGGCSSASRDLDLRGLRGHRSRRDDEAQGSNDAYRGQGGTVDLGEKTIISARLLDSSPLIRPSSVEKQRVV